MNEEYDTDFTNEIVCPYCGAENGIPDEHSDEGELVEMECRECEKEFVYQCNYSVDYSSQKAPCLNGGEHSWKKMVGAPRKYFENKYRCEYCNKEKKFNDEEIKKLGLIA